MAEKKKRGESEPVTAVDEPGMAERFQRGLQRALNTPPEPHGKNPTTPRAPKPKEQPATKGRVRKGNT